MTTTTASRSMVLIATTAVLLIINANILTTKACFLFMNRQQARDQVAHLLSLYPDILSQNGNLPYGNQGFGQQGLNGMLRPNNGFNNGLQPQQQQQLPNGQQQQQLPNGQNPFGGQQGFGQQPNYNGQQPNYNGQQQQQLPYNQFTG